MNTIKMFEETEGS